MAMKQWIIILTLCLIFVSSTAYSHESDRLKPRFFEGSLSLSNAPLIGQQATVILDLTPIAGDCRDVNIRFRIPDGIALRSRGEFYKAHIAMGSRSQYSAEIEAIRAGSYAIQATIYFRLSDNIIKTEYFFTCLIVGKTDSHLSDSLTFLSFSEENFEMPSPLAPSNIPQFAIAGLVTVNGHITYLDDNLSRSVPIKRVTIEVYEVNGNQLQKLGSTYTNSNGFYSFENLNNTDPEDGSGRDLKVRIAFKNEAVIVANASSKMYEFDLPLIENAPDGIINKDYHFSITDQYRPIGHIHNCVTDAYNALQEKLGWKRKAIEANWPYEGTSSRYSYSYWQTSGNIFNEHLRFPLEKAWERTTILHEYGHSAMTALYGYNYYNLPEEIYEGSHTVFTVTDPGFAMKEGWAEFFEAFVDDDAYNTVVYSNANTPNIEFNDWWSGSAKGIGSNTKGELVEGAVASILWDIADTAQSHDEAPNTDDDNISGMFVQIWDLMEKYKPVDILEFWDYWTQNSYGQTQYLYSIYQDHGVAVAFDQNIQKDIQLYAGWNLISMPIQPSDTSLTKVLQPITGYYESVWAYDTISGWKKYIPGSPSGLSDFNTVEPGRGYWIKMTRQARLNITGSQITNNITQLLTGWNLVGYKGTSAQPREQALLSIASKYQSIWTYDPVNGRWQKHIPEAPSSINNLNYIEPGKGYWINAKTSCSWNISMVNPAPSEMRFDNLSTGSSPQKPEIPSVIWGKIEINGIKTFAGRDILTVILRANNEEKTRYKLGTMKQYEDLYLLEFPAMKDCNQMEIYVEVDGNIIKIATTPCLMPGQVLHLNLSAEYTPAISALLQNYPNPFNSDTWIPYQLNNGANVEIRIYNSAGRLIRSLNLGYKNAGFHIARSDSAYWDGRDNEGEMVASGIYFYNIRAGNFTATGKMIVAK